MAKVVHLSKNRKPLFYMQLLNFKGLTRVIFF